MSTFFRHFFTALFCALFACGLLVSVWAVEAWVKEDNQAIQLNDNNLFNDLYALMGSQPDAAPRETRAAFTHEKTFLGSACPRSPKTDPLFYLVIAPEQCLAFNR